MSFRASSDWGCGLPRPPALGFGPSQRSIFLNRTRNSLSTPLTTGAGPYRLPGGFITVSRPGSFHMSRGPLWESGKVQGWGRNPQKSSSIGSNDDWSLAKPGAQTCLSSPLMSRPEIETRLSGTVRLFENHPMAVNLESLHLKDSACGQQKLMG